MSATLGGDLAEKVARLMGGEATGDTRPPASRQLSPRAPPRIPIIVSEGRSYPVDIQYMNSPGSWSTEGMEDLVKDKVMTALRRHEGDILCFLPGVGPIKKVVNMLKQEPLVVRGRVQVLPLHGNLTGEQQDQAIQPDPQGRRRIVVSTPIAESSVTISGVRVVVDSGLHRVPVYSPATGISRLNTVRISQSSADQRAGRAGRVAPGTCYRLWSRELDLQALPTPEIRDADLSPLALELAIWGSPDGKGLPWLDPPDAKQMTAALKLLKTLQAVDDQGQPTREGRQMSRLGVHPRLGHMVLQGMKIGAGELACVVSALLSERDIIQWGDGPKMVDIRIRMEALMDPGPHVNRASVHRILQSANQMMCQMRMAGGVEDDVDSDMSDSEGWVGGDARSSGDDEDDLDPDLRATRLGPTPAEFSSRWKGQLAKWGLLGAVLALGYPDRIAKLGGQQYVLPDGRAVRLPSIRDSLNGAEFLAVADLEGGKAGGNDVIYSAASLSMDAIHEYLSSLIQERHLVYWAPKVRMVRVRRERHLGSLVLMEEMVKIGVKEAQPSIMKCLRSAGWQALGVRPEAESLRLRVCWLRSYLQQEGLHDLGLPDLSTKQMMAQLEEWIPPHIDPSKMHLDLNNLPWVKIVSNMLTWDQRQAVDRLAPTTVTLPTGTTVPVDYSGAKPRLKCRLTEVFGMSSSPMVADGKFPVLMELLSPADRPVQITADLASFWSSQYDEVKKQMRNKYRKYNWPDDPMQAPPTRMTKKAEEKQKAQAEKITATEKSPVKKGKKKK